MEREEDIVRYSAEELRAMRSRGESMTDIARIQAMTEEELERAIADDPDWADIPENWYEQAEAVIPASELPRWLRLDEDVLAWFRARGPGYQTRINAVLRAFVEQQPR